MKASKSGAISVFLFVATLALPATLALAGGDPSIDVIDPYVRAVPPGVPNSAAFMSLRNTRPRKNALVGVSSSVAKVAELHTHTMKDGVMSMRRIAEIPVAANATTELKPGGLHIMLIGLNRPLKAGDRIDLTLRFADGQALTLSVPVKTVAAAMRHHHGGH